MKILIAVSIGLLLLTGCSGSQTDTTSQAPNIYANGYRLVKSTNTLHYASDDRLLITDYDYDFSGKEITITKWVEGEVEEPRVSRLYIDDAGRLTGGSYDYNLGTFINGTSNYTIRYDTEGKVIEYHESQYDNFTFNYVNGLLDNIVHYLSSSVYTFDFTYDAQGQRTSSLDAVTRETTHFEYNTEGQIASALDINQFGEELFSYEFGYDANGNLVSTLSYTPFGQLFSTDVYTYEASPEPVFNHGILRQAIEPYEATNASFVR